MLVLVDVGVLVVLIGYAALARSSPATVAKAGIPFTVLDTHGWFVYGGPVAATSLPGLLALISGDRQRDLSGVCPTEGCLAGTVVPAHTLLIAFSPSNNICNRVKKITVVLTGPRELTITTEQASACNDRHDGDGMRPPASDLLLAVPLNQLPATGPVTIRTPDSLYAGSVATTVRLR